MRHPHPLGEREALASRFPWRASDASDGIGGLTPPARLGVLCVVACVGCSNAAGSGIDTPLAVWGGRGMVDGRFAKPRAAAIDTNDNLYIVDKTARIQKFSRDGGFLARWHTPLSKKGCPTGLTVDRFGRLLVADTHYTRVLMYDTDGRLVGELNGTEGDGPGQFNFPTDAVVDSTGHVYVSEYGQTDRVQKFTAEGRYVLQFGGHGTALGQFIRPQGLEVDREDRIYVCDAGNHRIQVFDTEGKLVRWWGGHGTGPGRMSYPYDMVVTDDGTCYVCEYGNNRIQKFDAAGRSLGTWGRAGRRPGELFNPWAVVRDSRGDLHVLDTINHRVQRIRF